MHKNLLMNTKWCKSDDELDIESKNNRQLKLMTLEENEKRKEYAIFVARVVSGN